MREFLRDGGGVNDIENESVWYQSYFVLLLKVL